MSSRNVPRRMLAAVLLLMVALLVTTSGSTVSAQAPTEGFRALSGDAAAGFALPDDVQLITSFDLPASGLTYERYQQYFDAASVFGGQLTLYRNDAGTVTTVIGAHYPDIAPINAVGLSGADARGIVSRDIGAAGERLVDLRIHPDSGRHFYQVETRRADSRWIHWIDAGNGAVLNKYNALMHDCGSLTGSCGFGVAYDDGDSTDLKDLTGLTTFNGSDYLLQSQPEVSTVNDETYQRQETHDQGSTRRPFLGPIATDDDDSWVLPGDESPAQPALVDGHYYARVTDQYYLNIHGYDWVAAGDTDPDHDIKAMVVHAHYSVDYNNAFWNGSYIALGDGDQSTFRELTSMDVVGHELTHGVTDFTSNLVYQDEPGALNESISDIMGSSMEFYAETNGFEPATTLEPDWYIGEDFDLRGDTVPGFRNMEDPEEETWSNGTYPDHYTERYTGSDDNGGVHINSSIPNHAYYLLVNGGLNASCASKTDHNSAHCDDTEDTQDNDLNVTGIGVADAEQIFFQGFIALTEQSQMCAARAATEAVASSFGSQQVESTTHAWVAVGLTDKVCGGGSTDNPPSVSITNPSDGATVSGTVSVTADASDDDAVTQVEFFVDGGSIGVDSDSSDGWSTSWDTTAYADGSHSVSATATDTAGQTASDSVSVTVDNIADGISLTATGYKVRGLQKADLEWSGATSTDVDIYRDGSVIATTANDGSYTDNIDQRGGGSYTYKVCEAGTSTCSNEATVTF